MALTTAQLISNIQTAAQQLSTAASLTRAPTTTQKNAFNAAVSGLNANITELNKRKTCALS